MKFRKYTKKQLQEMRPDIVSAENASLRIVVQEQRQQISDLMKLVRFQRARIHVLESTVEVIDE